MRSFKKFLSFLAIYVGTLVIYLQTKHLFPSKSFMHISLPATEESNIVSSVASDAPLMSPVTSQPQQIVFDANSAPFRHPLPPQLARPPPPRLTLPQGQMIIRSPRIPTVDPRLQV